MPGPIVEKIILGADAAGLDAGLAKSAISINNFVKKVAAAGIAIATFHYAEKAFSDITRSITETAENIDKLGKTAQSIGVPIEELSKLKYAAELSGSSLEGISAGVGKLAKNMSEMGEDAARAFRVLGISVKGADGNLRPITGVMSDIAEKFVRMEDGAGKTALSMTMFGKQAGKEFIPLLNGGAAGLKKMYEEAEKFGLVISGETFRAAEAFNDNLTRLNKIKEGLTITVTAQLLPALQMLTGMLVSTVANSDRLATVGEKVKTALEATTVSVLYTVTALKGLGDALTAINNLGEALGSLDLKKIAGAWDWMTLVIEKGIKDIREVPQVAADLIKSWQNIGEGATTLADKMQAPALSSEKFRKALDDIRIKTMELRGEFSYLAPGFVQQAVSLDILTAKNIQAGQAIRLTTGEQRQLNDAMWKFRAAQITDENLLPWEKLQKQITDINFAFANGSMSVQTYQRALQRAAESAGATWSQFGINIAGTFKSLGDAFGKSSRQMFNIGKAGAIAQAIINTYQGSTKALAEIPFPFNFAAAAAVIAKGLADVAQIRAQQFPSAAMGGSFTVPGGLSGVDNRLVQMHLAAGEQVDITPANKAGGYDQRVIDVRGLGRERYDRAEVVQLIGAINDALSDGYRIKLI